MDPQKSRGEGAEKGGDKERGRQGEEMEKREREEYKLKQEEEREREEYKLKQEKREREEYKLKQEEERRGGQGEGVKEEESPVEPWMAQPSQETHKDEPLQQCLAF